MQITSNTSNQSVGYESLLVSDEDETNLSIASSFTVYYSSRLDNSSIGLKFGLLLRVSSA